MATKNAAVFGMMTLLGAPLAHADPIAALNAMTGCFMVDYSYVETEALKPGYQRDARVYDVNRGQTVKEWIYPVVVSPTKIRLQHILFAVDKAGNVIEDAMLRHTAEDWELDAETRYEFTSPLHWEPKSVEKGKGLWTRRITNLDDGLRYQCSAPWTSFSGLDEWKCDGVYAPIPGRETRDMGRRDYNTLMRDTRVIVYGSSWLERQENIKTIHAADGTRTPLARETGKNWYVRIQDSECAAPIAFTTPRRAYWDLLRETWDEIYAENKPFIEKLPPASPPRYFAMSEVEDQVLTQGLDVRVPAVRAQIKGEMLKVINRYRAP